MAKGAVIATVFGKTAFFYGLTDWLFSLISQIASDLKAFAQRIGWVVSGILNIGVKPEKPGKSDKMGILGPKMVGCGPGTE